MKIGDKAPDFELLDETGAPRRLSEMLTKGPVVLFFYPAAMTTGCTAESCHFRDLKAEFEAYDAQRVGISPDGVAKQREFSQLHNFDYPLLADDQGIVAGLFDVKPKLIKITPVRRATFVIDTDGTVLDVIKSEVRMSLHADKALEALAKRGA